MPVMPGVKLRAVMTVDALKTAVSAPSAQRDALSAEFRGDLQPAAECPDVRGEGANLGRAWPARTRRQQRGAGRRRRHPATLRRGEMGEEGASWVSEAIIPG
jgi:hypothetical protein